jgi:hypothetical protein
LIFWICNGVLGIISDSSIPPTIPSRSKNKIEGFLQKLKSYWFFIEILSIKKPKKPNLKTSWNCMVQAKEEE